LTPASQGKVFATGSVKHTRGDSSTLEGSARAKGGIAESGERKNAQSINRLCWVNQLYPSTTEQAESRGVTYSSTGVESPEGKEMSIRTFLEIIVPGDPSKRQRPSGGIGTQVRLLVVQRTGSMKQSDEPESTSARKSDWICADCKMGHKDFGSERAEALSHKTDSTRSRLFSQPSGRTEF
jgi:hypothetical protein